MTFGPKSLPQFQNPYPQQRAVLPPIHLKERTSAVSEGSVMLFRASLLGMTRQEQCDILARKIANLSHAGAPAYSECFIISAPADLPDGDYDVKFEGHSASATKEH